MAALGLDVRLRGISLLLACAGVLAGAMPAQAASPESKLITHGIAHDMLYALSMEAQQGVAVGDFGVIMETADGGTTWTRQAKAPTDLALFGVVRRQGHCIAAGQSGLLMAAPDCKQWTVAAPVSKERILAVDVNAGGMAWAVGGFGTVLKSSDWGKTWQAVSIDWKQFASEGVEPHLYDVHVADSGEVTLVGEFELILRSSDGGNKWQALHKGKRSVFGLTLLANGEAYAVGQEGMILKSTDKGASWSELASGTRAILTGIWANAEGQAVASGIYTVLYSGDGGKSWQEDRSKLAKANWNQAVAGVETTKGQLQVMLVGTGGTILSVQR